MKNTLRIITLMTILHAGSAFAASGAEGSGISLVGWIFIGFMGVVIAFQFIPAVVMFGSMMRAVFGKVRNQKRVAENGKSNNS
jgi:hypothetical protein